MKRIFSLFVCLILLLNLSGCTIIRVVQHLRDRESSVPDRESSFEAERSSETESSSETIEIRFGNEESSEDVPVDTSIAEVGGVLTSKEGIQVEFTPGLDVPEDVALTVTKRETITDDELGATYTVYDFSLGDVHDLGGYVNIRIPYDGSGLEPGEDPAGCIAGMYFNDETQEWESVLYDVDTAAKELIIHTDHFSTYGCFEFVNEGKRLMKITKINDWMVSVDNDKVMEAIQELLDNEGVPGDACRELTRPVLEESFNSLAAATSATGDKATIVGNLTTLFISGSGLGEAIGNNEWANGFTTALGYAGIATSIASLASTALKADKTNNEIIGMYKDAVYLLGSLSQSATLGTIGASVWLIDKGLMDMGNYSYDKIAEDTTKAYRHYYSKYMTRTRAEWRWAFKDIAMQAIRNRESAETAIMAEIDRWCGLFWSIDTDTYTNILIDVDQRGRGWPDAATKEAITADYKRDLIRLLEPILDDVKQDLEWKLEEEQEKAFNKIKNMLNATLTFELTEELKEGQQEAKYANYTAVFATLSSIADPESWKVTLNRDGLTIVKATLIGYLVAGRPTEIQLYAPGKTPGIDPPERKIPFTYTAPKTVIPIGDEGIAGKYKLTLTLDYAEPAEYDAELVLGVNGEADLFFPMLLPNMVDALQNETAEITYSEGTVHFKGTYDENTHLFTGQVSSDLGDYVLNGASFTILFTTDQTPITATGTGTNHPVVFGVTFDISVAISMVKTE